MATATAPAASSWLDSAWAALRPPPKLSLSQWADRHHRLSAESSANPGKWTTRPYQRAILDAITDPAVERVSVMKSSRVGYTKMVDAAIAYFMAGDPCPILVVQPTVETAKIYSKEEIAPMLRDVPALAGLVKTGSVRSSENSITHKSFPGGTLSMVGANSGSGLRMVSRRVVIFDEVDAFPPSAGADGDPVKLGEKRTEDYWNRKIIAGSTPLVAGSSRIEELFLAGDRRRYYVPCPHCDHMDFLRFRKHDGDEDARGHRMWWPENEPEAACFVCSSCGCLIEETHKAAMLEAGEWRAEAKFKGHASFHIWAAYSLSPNTTWGQIVAEFIEANKRPETLRTFINTMLGETWKEKGEAPDWERLYDRREAYAIGTVPGGAIMVTSGVDVQRDRLVVEVVGWAPSKESWSVEIRELYGDTSLEATVPGSPWAQLEVLLARQYPGVGGLSHSIAMMAVDSSDNTQVVYNWCRLHPMTRVIACKGSRTAHMLVGVPSSVDVTFRGRKMRRGYKVWSTGVNIAKSELYGWLRLKLGKDGPPPGYCHFPEYPEEYFQQLTAEQLMTVVNRKTRRTTMMWVVQPNRENHFLDCFDEETEVLTRDGWSSLASLNGSELLATVNLQTDELEYQAPDALIARRFHGDMVGLRGRSVDILVTPNHRMVTYKKRKDPKTKRWRFDVPAEITLAKDLTVHHALKRTATWRGSAPATVRVGTHDIDAGDLAELLGWYVSEGYTTRTEWHGTVRARGRDKGAARVPVVQVGYRVGICQNPGAKSERIKSLLSRTPWKWQAQPKKYVASSKDLLFYLRAEAGCGVANKRVPRWIKDAPPEIIERFVDAAILGDGWTQDGHRTYATVSQRLADDMQELFLKLGRSANIRRRPAKPWSIEGRSGPAGRDQFHVSELKGDRQYLIRNGKKTPRFLGELVPYDGMVYCAEVPNGTLICRRRGLAFVAGNCRILARVAAAVLGIDRLPPGPPAVGVPQPPAAAAASSPEPAAGTAAQYPAGEGPRSAFWRGPRGGRGGGGGSGWFKRRR